MTVAELIKELENKPPTYQVVKSGHTAGVIHEVVTAHDQQEVRLY